MFLFTLLPAPLPPRKIWGLYHVGLESAQIWSFFFQCKCKQTPWITVENSTQQNIHLLESVVNDTSLLPTESKLDLQELL